MADAGETDTYTGSGREKETHMYDGPGGVNEGLAAKAAMESANAANPSAPAAAPGCPDPVSVGAYKSVSAGPANLTWKSNGELEVGVGLGGRVGGYGASVSVNRTLDDAAKSYNGAVTISAMEFGLGISPQKGTVSGSVGLGFGPVGAGAYVDVNFCQAAMDALNNANSQIGQQGLGNSGSPFGGMFGFPIVLDLDGDGLDLVALDKSKAFYDIDGDGYLENVGWVGDGDGFLSIDLNGDGLIVDPKELAFALSTDDPNDTDLQGLAATYDSNQDGVLDAKDAEFAKFKVWIDADQDGACDAGEVKTLANVGITSVNLTSDNKEEVIAGNKVYGTTTYTKTDGTTGKVGDVGLATSAAGWKREEVTGGIKFNFEGTGDNAGKALFEAAAATVLIMDVGASGLIGAMGAELDDSLSTSTKDDVILGGGAGNDKIKGGDGNDWLAGGEGIDSMSGGDGHDILFVDSEDKIDGGAGFDVAIVTDDRAVNYDLAKIGIEAVSAGAGDDVLNGANRNLKRITFALAA